MITAYISSDGFYGECEFFLGQFEDCSQTEKLD